MSSNKQLTSADFADFIDLERKNYADSANNSFATALGILRRKYTKLEILRQRTQPLIALYLSEPISDLPSGLPEEFFQKLEARTNLLLEIELNFESLFVFGSILCDEIAHFILYLFGSPRNVKFGGHRELSKNFHTYAQSLSLEFSPGFQETAGALERDLCDYRDKQIVHDFHPRKLDAIGFTTPSNDVRLSYGLMYPKDTDTFVHSKNWSELSELLSTYMHHVLSLVQCNRQKSRFKHALLIGSA